MTRYRRRRNATVANMFVEFIMRSPPQENPMQYVDGFLLSVPKKNLQAYRRVASKAGKIWREHGALEFRECVGDDLNTKMGVHSRA